MTADIIGNVIVELARLGVMAYAIYFGGNALLIWIQRVSLSDQQVVDEVRRRGIEVNA